MKDRVSVNKEILEKIANYLATKPFQEVAGMIHELSNDVKLIEETEKEG